MRIGPFGIWEILIILIVALLVFGPRRLPELAKGAGQAVRLFRKEMRDFKADLDMDERPAPRRDTTLPAAPPAPPTPASTTTPANAAAAQPEAPKSDRGAS